MGAPPLIHPVVQERGLLFTHFPAQLPRCGHLVTVERFLERLLSFLILLKLFEFMPLSLRCPPRVLSSDYPSGTPEFCFGFFSFFFSSSKANVWCFHSYWKPLGPYCPQQLILTSYLACSVILRLTESHCLVPPPAPWLPSTLSPSRSLLSFLSVYSAQPALYFIFMIMFNP